MSERYLTPPMIARKLGVSKTKVLGWIAARQLQAVNLASSTLGRPRYGVSPEELDRFLAGRAACPAPKPKKQSRQRLPAGWVERY